jgi:hypothetical protein
MKYHKMEKGVAKLFNEVELFQDPLLLMTSHQAQELTLKSEYSKMISSLAQDNDVSTQKMK